ncbi:glycosyltransferase family 39 protein [Streptomyces sp. NBC_00083]|uniref:glycosyltransferase family 39 protein n=1 Tax=Streptomyces sp. NBC_00083 TaxID=2975647 RepID=UPI002254E2AE|nr:glycosyltransferase family 39 protein [Streptomyces sp. NBC_00083]MCX5382180.1 glycosyltransferase family 39 protein [Streptomyces sp. NBC_00083]
MHVGSVLTGHDTPVNAPEASAPVLRRAWTAVAAFAAVRALGVLVLAVWPRANGAGAHELLSARWDSLWYVRVAESGYDFTLTAPDGRVLSDQAFFPLLPWLERAVGAVSPLGPGDAGLLVSGVAGPLAAWGMYLIGHHLHGHRAGLLLVALWAAVPVGIVQSMAYSEALFVALAAWALYAVARRRWIEAGLLASLAGLTRPVGLAVAAALWAGAAVEARRTRHIGTRMLAGVVLAPLGAAGFILWVGLRRGGPLAYLEVQAEWGNGFDGGLAYAKFIVAHLGGWPVVLAGLGLIVGTALALWAYGVCVRQRQPLPLLVYTGIVVALALCSSGYFGSKPRLLLPAFPLLLPVALALSRVRAARAASVVAALALGSAVYGATWLSGSGPP